MKIPPIYTYLSEGKYIFTLRDVTDRPKELPQANYKGTGKALVKVTLKCTTETIEWHEGAEIKPRKYVRTKAPLKWGKEDLSLVGTSTLI